MSCWLYEDNDKLEVVLGFDRDELLYDIRTCAYVEGHVVPPEGEHARHMIIDVGEEGNVDRVTRILDMEIARVREMLYPYTRHGITRRAMDDHFRQRRVYGIVMLVPSTFSQTTLALLERLVHEYLVTRALADWLSITNPAKASVWQDKAEEAEHEIRTAAQTRMARVRIRPHGIF